MKIVLSRKGFDSGNGGVASPILPDGTLLSLPIPDRASRITYDDLCWQNHAIGTLVESLTRKRIKRRHRAHLDPDLYRAIYPRPTDWRPLFGQDGAAQSHLANQGVAIGDLFLFFGWFRAVKRVGRGYRFAPNAPDQHILYGWLQVGEMLQGSRLTDTLPPWAADHPHCQGGRGERNTLYLAAQHLTLPAMQQLNPLAGAGLFVPWAPHHVLTAPTQRRTNWRLPHWFYPTEERPPLTYHSDIRRWHLDEAYAYLQSAARGQEFVFDTRHYPEAIEWIGALFQEQ